MIVLNGSGGELVPLRGALRHSWIENLIDAREPDDVADLHTCAKAVRQPFDDDIASGGSFDRRLDEVRELAGQMIDGFSPARMVDSGPLAQLPGDLRTSMKAVVHDLYLAESGVQGVAMEVTKAGEAFGVELRRFREIWERFPAASPGEVAAGFRRLKNQGKKLHDALGRVPEGIELP